MEHLITISLKEYNEIKDITENLLKAFDEKKTILFHDSFFPGHAGYPIHRFTVVNTDIFMDDLRNKITDLENQNKKLIKQLSEQEKPTKETGFNFFYSLILKKSSTSTSFWP